MKDYNTSLSLSALSLHFSSLLKVYGAIDFNFIFSMVLQLNFTAISFVFPSDGYRTEGSCSELIMVTG